MSNSIERLLINLKIISQIQPYQKINAKSEFISIEYYHWLSSISRWLRTDDRHICLKRLSEITVECKTVLKNLRHEKSNIDHEKIEKRIQKGMHESIKGLMNLKKTYENDTTTLAYLDIIIENIKEFLCIKDSSSDNDSIEEEENIHYS